MEDFIKGILLGLIGDHPYVMALVFIMGALRAVMKIAFELAYKITASTPNPSDDAIVKQIDESQAMKVVRFLLDYLGSIKLPK